MRTDPLYGSRETTTATIRRHRSRAVALAMAFSLLQTMPVQAESGNESLSLAPLGAARTSPPPVPGQARVSRKDIQDAARATYPSSHYQRGLYFKHRNMLDRALIEFLKATQENPRLVQSFYEQALIFRQRGYLKLAESALEQSMAVNPDFHHARLLLATIRLEQGNVGGAVKELSRSLGLPGLETARTGTQPGRTDAPGAPAPRPSLPAVMQTPHYLLPEVPAPPVVNPSAPSPPEPQFEPLTPPCQTAEPPPTPPIVAPPVLKPATSPPPPQALIERPSEIISISKLPADPAMEKPGAVRTVSMSERLHVKTAQVDRSESTFHFSLPNPFKFFQQNAEEPRQRKQKPAKPVRQAKAPKALKPPKPARRAKQKPDSEDSPLGWLARLWRGKNEPVKQPAPERTPALIAEKPAPAPSVQPVMPVPVAPPPAPPPVKEQAASAQVVQQQPIIPPPPVEAQPWAQPAPSPESLAPAIRQREIAGAAPPRKQLTPQVMSLAPFVSMAMPPISIPEARRAQPAAATPPQARAPEPGLPAIFRMTYADPAPAAAPAPQPQKPVERPSRPYILMSAPEVPAPRMVEPQAPRERHQEPGRVSHLEYTASPEPARSVIEQTQPMPQAPAPSVAPQRMRGSQLPVARLTTQTSVFKASVPAAEKGEIITRQPPPVKPPAETQESQDFWTKRLKYLAEHGNATLKDGEAFMFSEATGEAVLFRPGQETIRRKVAPPRDSVEVVKERRPDIALPQNLQYNLSLLGRLMPQQQPPQAQHGPSSPNLPNFTIKQLMNEKEGFVGWLKQVFKL